MATSTTSRTRTGELSSPRASSWLRRVVIVVVGAVLVVAGSLLALRVARAGVLPGVEVEGIPVGGLSAQELRAALNRLEDQRGSAKVHAVRGRETFSGAASELGYRLDVDATAEDVLYRGRQGNPFTALADHLHAFSAQTRVPAIEQVKPGPLNRWVDKAAAKLELRPREGMIRFEGASVTRVDPRSGAIVRRGPLRRAARVAALSGDGGTLRVETRNVAPVMTTEDVDAAAAEARRAVSAPVTFTRSGAQATLEPAEIGEILQPRRAGEGDDTHIELVAPPEAVTAALGESAIAGFEQEPVEADVELAGGRVQVIEGQNGFRYDADKAAAQLLQVATGKGDRTVVLDGTVIEADLTTAEARALEISEKVSSFTTYHDCCETRVTNIHRIADIVDGALIQPGETFSVNGYVGERTKAKGFVAGGAILDGEYVEEVGGGVSQFATTMYNAAYFGGYEIAQHKAHSYYISRYPEGREATLSYPSVDLQVHNDSPYGILVDTSYTDTSITVTFYGKQWVDVSTTTGPRTNIQQGETQYEENDDLPRGSEVVVQSPSEGFDVVVTRTLRYPDGRVETEEEFTHYNAQPQIIERNRPGVSD